jgi:hypothetical protein
VRVHLDYGLKGSTGYAKVTNLSGCNLTEGNDNDAGSTVDMCDNNIYTFSVSGAVRDSREIQNYNVFKNDPGIGGLVTASGTGDPVASV